MVADENLDPDVQNMFDEDVDDDSMTMDLSDVSDDVQREPLPAGIHECVVENHEFGSSSSGNPMITWTLRVIEPEYENRFLFYHTVVNKESGKRRLKKLLVRVCPDVELTSFNPKTFCDEGRALGLPCRAKVRVSTYQGNPTNDVTDILPPSDEENFLDG